MTRVQPNEEPTLIDVTDGTVIYEAFFNDNPATPLYAIRKKYLVGTVWHTAWSGGDRRKIYSWDNRTTLTYSERPEIENLQA